ncbi:unnamed protein product [Somion occarium]|uniref:Bacteriophage T5 Orf172 DNA-binding domain-containing protein n=1 Tax=Somion occarium TaxID=3059160 RepID=A0ABP1D6J0_9APHY
MFPRNFFSFLSSPFQDETPETTPVPSRESIDDELARLFDAVSLDSESKGSPDQQRSNACPPSGGLDADIQPKRTRLPRSRPLKQETRGHNVIAVTVADLSRPGTPGSDLKPSEREQDVPSTPKRPAIRLHVPGSAPPKLYSASTAGPNLPPPIHPCRRKSSGSLPQRSVQCSSEAPSTKERCKNMVSIRLLDSTQDSDDPNVLAQIIFCHLHNDPAKRIPDYLSNGKPVPLQFITPQLSEPTKTKLQLKMAQQPSISDSAGKIYVFPYYVKGQHGDILHYKLGKAKDVELRQKQWRNQCGTDAVQPLVYIYPRDDTNIKYYDKLERLIHIELADWCQNGWYLEDSDKDSVFEEARKEKEPCKTVHKEIFSFRRPRSGQYVDMVLALIIEIVMRWGDFIEAYC